MNQNNNPQETQTQTIVPIGALVTDRKTNQAQRRASYTKLGSADFDEGKFEVWANKKDGSLLIISPDRTHYLIDSTVAVNQIYKYWKAFREGAVQEVESLQTPAEDALPGTV